MSGRMQVSPPPAEDANNSGSGSQPGRENSCDGKSAPTGVSSRMPGADRWMVEGSRRAATIRTAHVPSFDRFGAHAVP